MHVQLAHWPWRAWHSYSMHMRSCSICMCMYCYICCRGRTAMLCMYTRARTYVLYMYMHTCMCCCATVHVLLRCCGAAGTCAHMYKGCYKGIIIKYGRTRRDASSIYTCTCTYTLTLKVISSPNEKIGQLQLER